MPQERTGLLIIRAWVEAESSKPLRAHVRLTTNLAAGIQRELSLADIESVCGLVETWLREFMTAGEAT